MGVDCKVGTERQREARNGGIATDRTNDPDQSRCTFRLWAEGDGPFQVPMSLAQECAPSEDIPITNGRTLSPSLYALAKGSPHGPIYAPVCESMITMRVSL